LVTKYQKYHKLVFLTWYHGSFEDVIEEIQ
jgi:hypothetical protein